MRRLLPLLLALLLLCGCAAETAPEPEFMPDDAERLVIYTSHREEVYSPLVREFEQRTGIWVELHTGGTSELLEEIASGGTNCDLIFGGGIDSLSAYSEYFLKYESAELERVEPHFLCDGSCTPFSSLPIVLIYNPKILRLKPPTGWQSLLDSSWRGKIAFADVRVSGSSFTALSTMIQALGGDAGDITRRFAENLDGKVLEGSSLVVDAVADGRYYIGITLEETALKAIASGSSISLVYPEEGTSDLPDGAAIIAGCRHSDNAKLFIDFILSDDVQSRLPEHFSRRSVLKNASGDSESMELIDYDLEWASEQRALLICAWESVLSEAEA